MWEFETRRDPEIAPYTVGFILLKGHLRKHRACHEILRRIVFQQQPQSSWRKLDLRSVKFRFRKLALACASLLKLEEVNVGIYLFCPVLSLCKFCLKP